MQATTLLVLLAVLTAGTESKDVQVKVKWQHDVINNNISALWQAMETGHTLAEEMADEIATNKKEIALNDDIINDLNVEMSNLNSENTAEAADIARVKIDISENQANIMNNKALNDQNFLELDEKVLTNTNAAPVIGSIIPWIPSKIALGYIEDNLMGWGKCQ